MHNERIAPEDDNWDAVVSTIELAKDIPTEALAGIEEFSHLEIIYHFHLVDKKKAVAGSRHPRNNKDWPVVGSFAQRNKSRPNLLGVTTVELVSHDGRTIKVKKLDAINGTPILDIKPVMKEFLPQSPVSQPKWSTELMKGYWNNKH